MPALPSSAVAIGGVSRAARRTSRPSVSRRDLPSATLATSPDALPAPAQSAARDTGAGTATGAVTCAVADNVANARAQTRAGAISIFRRSAIADSGITHRQRAPAILVATAWSSFTRGPRSPERWRRRPGHPAGYRREVSQPSKLAAELKCPLPRNESRHAMMSKLGPPLGLGRATI